MSRIPENDHQDRCINLLLADLPVMMRELLQSAFANVPYIKVLDPGGEARHKRALGAGLPVDVILLGLSREESVSNSANLLESLLGRYQKAKAIVLTQEPAHEESIALLRVGAKGIFCIKDLRFDLLCKSVHCVYQGQIWADNDLVRYMIETLSRPQSREVTDSRGKKLLTAREQEVLHLLADGMSNYQLAAHLKLSEHTIKNHLFRIYEKLGVSNRMEAVLYALSPRKVQALPIAIRETQSSSIPMSKAG